MGREDQKSDKSLLILLFIAVFVGYVTTVLHLNSTHSEAQAELSAEVEKYQSLNVLYRTVLEENNLGYWDFVTVEETGDERMQKKKFRLERDHPRSSRARGPWWATEFCISDHFRDFVQDWGIHFGTDPTTHVRWHAVEGSWHFSLDHGYTSDIFSELGWSEDKNYVTFIENWPLRKRELFWLFQSDMFDVRWYRVDPKTYEIDWPSDTPDFVGAE